MDTEELGHEKRELDFSGHTDIYAGTDGYGLCMAVALKRYIASHGGTSTLTTSLKETSSKTFWGTDHSTEGADRVCVLGIPFNTFDEESEEYSYQIAKRISRRIEDERVDSSDTYGIPYERSPRVILANRHYSIEPDLLPSDGGVTDVTTTLETQLSQEESITINGINLVTLARFIIKDRSVLNEIIDENEREKYEYIAIGVEAASRPPIGWVYRNKESPSFYADLERESKELIGEALVMLSRGNWNYFKDRADEFESQLIPPRMTKTPSSNITAPSLVLIDLADQPPAYQALILEWAYRKTGAQYALGVRFESLRWEGAPIEYSPYTVKLIPNWRNSIPVEESWQILEQALQKDGRKGKIVGSKRIHTLKPDDAESFSEAMRDVLLAIAPELNTVFEGSNVIAIVGDSNTGKTSIAEMLERYCNIFRGRSDAKREGRMDLAGYTTDSYIDAAIHLDQALVEGDRTKILESKELLALEDRYMKYERRTGLADRWPPQLVDRTVAIADGASPRKITFLDLPGARSPELRDTPQIMTPLIESDNVDAVFIVGRNAEEIESWRMIIRECNRQRALRHISPLKILGEYITSKDPIPASQTDLAGSDNPEMIGTVGGVARESVDHPDPAFIALGALIASLALDDVSRERV